MPNVPLQLAQLDPGERGRAHGEHWRAPIRALGAILAARAAARGVTAAQLEADAMASWSEAGRVVPSLHEELVGIAAGADVAQSTIALLNDGRAWADDGAGATSVYCRSLQGPLLGHVWDLHPQVAPWVRVVELLGATGVRQCVVTVPGCLGLAGINAHGLAVSSVRLSLARTCSGLGWPVLTRHLLACDSAAQARQRIVDTPRCDARYWVLADERDFLGLESSDALVVLTQKGGKAAHLHTNHCFDPVLRRIETVPRATTTYARLNTASTIYAQQRPKTADALWTMLHGHEGQLGTLCRHAGEDGAPAVTAAIALFMPAQAGLRIVGGCQDRGGTVVSTTARPSGEHSDGSS